jgi:hypothetical protein
MTPDETATVLAKAAAYDRRTVGRADVAAWHEALHDLDLADCLHAVTSHYQQPSPDWLMPGHIRAHVRAQRGARPYDRPVRDVLALPPGQRAVPPTPGWRAARHQLRTGPVGTCAECGRHVRVRRDGLAYSHFDPDGRPCWGATRPAIQEA